MQHLRARTDMVNTGKHDKWIRLPLGDCSRVEYWLQYAFPCCSSVSETHLGLSDKWALFWSQMPSDGCHPYWPWLGTSPSWVRWSSQSVSALDLLADQVLHMPGQLAHIVQIACTCTTTPVNTQKGAIIDGVNGTTFIATVISMYLHGLAPTYQ